jgi:hypothetical protein
MKRAVLLAALALTGCMTLPPGSAPGYTVYEAAVGANVTKSMPWSRNLDGGFAGPSDTVRFTVRREHGNGHTFVSYSHISHLSSGWPVNNERTEDWLDIIEFGVRFDSRGNR